MQIIGLTGGIASGKSTVRGRFASYGAYTIDADDLNTVLFSPGGEGYKPVRDLFGSYFFHPSGEVDRKKLGDLIFKDQSARKALEAILHPLIHASYENLKKKVFEKGFRVLVYEAALIVETGLHKSLDGLVTVHAERETRFKRLTEGRRMTPEEANARLDAQMAADAARFGAATWAIKNDEDLVKLYQTVDYVWDQITRKKP